MTVSEYIDTALGITPERPDLETVVYMQLQDLADDAGIEYAKRIPLENGGTDYEFFHKRDFDSLSDEEVLFVGRFVQRINNQKDHHWL